MRKNPSNRRRPDNVRQFRGYRPPARQRPVRTRHSSIWLVIGGVTGGVLLGLAATNLKVTTPRWLASAPAAETPSLCIADVHDGDTIRSCDGERIRIENIDAPELSDSPKCTDRRRNGWCDYELAERSRDELASFLAEGPVTISRSGTDKYDRTLAKLNVDGEDAGEYLVSKGLARPWQ